MMTDFDDFSAFLALQSAIRNCNNFQYYHQLVILDKDYLSFDFVKLAKYLRDTYGAIICKGNLSHIIITNSTNTSTIEIYDFSLCAKGNFLGKRFHNIICLRPISKDIYSEVLAPMIVTYKNKEPENKGISW